MSKMQNVYQIAQSLISDRVLTFYDVCNVLLKDIPCIVCMESTADLLGYSNWGSIKTIHIYTTKEINKSYLKCHIVDNLDNIPYINYDGIKTSPIEMAIVDMLKNNNTDSQVLYETFAKYYYYNNDSYCNLDIPNKLKKKANEYMKEAILYYQD